MMSFRGPLSFAALLALGACYASAQPVISAKSGVIAYVEGQVFLGDQQVEYSVAKFPEIKENSVVRTEDGRAEILLTPGVIMRIGEHSSFKLIGNRLVDTRLELLTGEAVVEADDVAKDTNVTVVVKNASVTMAKAGIYRFETQPAKLKVFKGLADVKFDGEPVPVGAGRMATLEGTSASVQKFNVEETDALDHWSHRRGEYLAMANVSAAKSLLDSGGYSSALGTLGLGLNNCVNSWAFNQWYGMYTYMPCRGSLYSPYGYRFWSPYSVMRAYYVPTNYNGGGYRGGMGGGSTGYAYPTAASTSAGYSGVMSSAGSSGGGGGFSGGGGGVSAGAGGGGVSSAGGAGGGGHGGGSGGGGGGGGGHH